MSDPFAHPSILSGTHASLVPLTGAHVAPMRDAVRDGALASLWYTQVPDVAGVDAYLDDAVAMRDAGTALPYAVLDAEGVVVGSTRFYRWDARTPRVTIGYTWIVPRVQRSGLNTEAKLLMLAHAFDTLGLRGGGVRDQLVQPDIAHRDRTLGCQAGRGTAPPYASSRRQSARHRGVLDPRPRVAYRAHAFADSTCTREFE